MQENSGNFLAITQDGFDEEGRKLAAHDIIWSRLNEKLWPIYERTKNKKTILTGDLLFFYAGGKGPLGGHVVAMAKLHSIIAPSRRLQKNLHATGVIDSLIKLDEIKRIQPLRLKPILIREGVIKEENKKWGAFLMGGFTKIPQPIASVLMGKKT